MIEHKNENTPNRFVSEDVSISREWRDVNDPRGYDGPGGLTRSTEDLMDASVPTTSDGAEARPGGES